MPHAIIRQGPTPEQVFEGFQAFKDQRPDGSILETRGAYLRNDREALLIHALAFELGPAQHFFVAVERKKDQLTVRIFPHPSPERTAGVQAIVGRVAGDVLALGGRVEKTNLEGLGAPEGG